MFDTNQLYLFLSALQKSIRWCEVNASRYFAQQLMNMGVPDVLFNRLMVIAAEDVGLADPSLIGYERQCYNDFNELLKQNGIKKGEAFNFPEVCDVVDRAVIAAAISYKSRLLPMISFPILFDIYEKENFRQDLSKYLRQFVMAVENEDEKEALYYAYVIDIFFNSKERILTVVQKQSERRNEDLIQKWLDEYNRNKDNKKYNELATLALNGSVVLLCRDLHYPHGEYKDGISQHLPLPIKTAKIPDRAYDKHTADGRKKGRSFKHFFDNAASLKNERFENDWEDAGRVAYDLANKKGLGSEPKIIGAIKKKKLTNELPLTV